MTIENKSRNAFLAVTLVTVLSIVSVLTVYAVFIATFTGGDVTIGGGATGSITYSLDNSTWLAAISPSNVDTIWYSKLYIDGGQYSGTAVTITWTLQRKIDDTNWSNLGSNTTTSMSLGASAQDVYATATGLIDDNRDWGQDVTEEGTYRVIVNVDSA